MLLCRRGLRYQRTMTRQEIGRPGWLLVVSLVYCAAKCCVALPFENKTGPDETNGPRVFSPRMDYDEWTPLGRGDPLKNDPTFDYVPPILDRVQYWMDSHTTEATSKSDILVLGVTAKKTSPKIPEQFLKFVNGPKFMRNQEAPLGGYANDFTGSRGAEPPKVIRKTTFRNGVKDYRNQDRLEAKPASYYPSSYYNQNSKPETMMLPPPMIRNPDASRPHQKHRYSTQTEAGPLLQLKYQIYDRPQNPYSLPDAPPQPKPPRKHHPQIIADRQKQTTRETLSHIETIESYTPSGKLPATQYPVHASTTPSVYSEKSNLIYQSSQTISSDWLAKTRQPTQSPPADLDGITWRTGPSNDNREYLYEDDLHQAAGSSHHEVVLGPNANIIVEGDNSAKEDIVIGQKDIVSPDAPSSDPTLQQDKDEALPAPGTNSENMFIVLANSSPPSQTTFDPNEDTPVTVVMPEKLVEQYLADTTEPNEQELPRTDSTTLDTRLVPQTEKPEEKPMPHHSFVNTPTNPQSMVYTNDVPGQPHSPTRLAVPYQPMPTRHAPHREFGEPPPQRVAAHRQPPHARPAQVMTHHSPLLGSGINFRETPPPPPPPRRLRPAMKPLGHADPNNRFAQMQPFKTMMTMAQGMTNPNHQLSQPSRPHQHQFGPSVPITTPSPAARPVTSLPINSIRDLLLKDEAHRNGQRMPEVLETTTSSPLKLETHFEDDQPKDKIAATTESSTVATPTSTSAAPTTTAQALTTDPIFSHYKQPANPMRGPMYLIIQGHSKVKTYKPWVDKHGNQLENGDNLESTTSKGISEFEKFVKENTRRTEAADRVRESSTSTERAKEQSLGEDSLLSFVDSGLGAFPVPLSRRDLGDKDSNSLAITERPV